MFLKLNQYKQEKILLDIGIITEKPGANCCMLKLAAEDDLILVEVTLAKIRALNPELFERSAEGSAQLFEFTRLDGDEAVGFQETPTIIPARFIANVTGNEGSDKSRILIEIGNLDVLGLRRRFGETGFDAKGGLAELKELNPGFAWPERPTHNTFPTTQIPAPRA